MVPRTEQVNKIIAHSSRKYSMIFSILRDTGLRPIELHRLTLKNIDLEKGILHPESAKGGNPRALKLKKSTSAMLKEFATEQDFSLNKRMFPTTTVMTHVFMRIARASQLSGEDQRYIYEGEDDYGGKPTSLWFLVPFFFGIIGGIIGYIGTD
ncbi:MAG: tyrosine-type recombinase/integrase [Candidatus Bathyarchaeota archaeon]|nr:tyrosine-type recombinase/integrase [Candidatus Bathyarchaeota archaeon]